MDEVCLKEVCLSKVRLRKIRPGKIRPLKVCPLKLRLKGRICRPPLIPFLHPLLQPCKVFLVRYYSHPLRLVIGIEVNLFYSVVGQKSDKTLPVSDVLTSLLSSAGDRYGTTNTQNGS